MCCRGSLLWSDKMVRKLTFGHWDWFIKSGRDYLRKFAVKFVILSRHYYYFNELLCLILILQCLKVKLLYNNTFEYKSSKCNIGQLPRVSTEDRVVSVFEPFDCLIVLWLLDCKFSNFFLFHPSLFIQYSTEECSTVQYKAKLGVFQLVITIISEIHSLICHRDKLNLSITLCIISSISKDEF